MYRLESGTYIDSNPFYILPLDTDISDISKVMLEALECSRQLTKLEEGEFWLGKELLPNLKERSFNSLYKNSSCFMVSIIKNEFVLEPQVYMGRNQGLEIDEKRTSRFDVFSGIQELVKEIQV